MVACWSWTDRQGRCVTGRHALVLLGVLFVCFLLLFFLLFSPPLPPPLFCFVVVVDVCVYVCVCVREREDERLLLLLFLGGGQSKVYLRSCNLEDFFFFFFFFVRMFGLLFVVFWLNLLYITI